MDIYSSTILSRPGVNEQIRAQGSRQQLMSCQHDYHIVSQRHAIVGQSIVEQGSARFVQQLVCAHCCSAANSTSTNPLCLDCKIELEHKKNAEMLPRAAEYQAAQGSSLDVCGGFGQAMGFCCPQCNRPHVYKMEGD